MEKKEMKVSIIVPVYNTEKYVAKTLDSLVNQTLDSYEIIVVNDGSTDNSQEIIKEYTKKYPNLIQAYYKENGGLGSARNYGLQYAKGEYVGFVDSDDWVDEKMYQAMYQKAVEEKCDIVLCDFTSIYDGWKTGWCSKGYRGPNDYPTKQEYMLYCLDPATACNKLFKKELFYCSKFKQGWYEDVATIPILFSYAKEIGYLPIQLYYYRQHNGSITHNNRDRRTLDIQGAWLEIIEKVKQEYREEIIWAVYNSIITFIYFKPVFADEFIEFAITNQKLFKNNVYVKSAIENKEIENIFIKKLIPKKIHYFWFGNNPKNELQKKCIESWKKYAPDFEIIEWNENNCDINECTYVKEAYEEKKWAFVADYFRIKRIYEYGGIYLDTDVEFLTDISILRLNTVFFAFETKTGINAAIFGAQEKNNLIYKWFFTYKGDHLKREDGTLNTSNTIVVRLTKLLTEGYNVILNGQEQVLKGDIKIYPPNVLTLNMYDGKCITQHHYEASWWGAKAGITSYKYEVLKDYFFNIQIEEIQDKISIEIKQEETINNLMLQLEQMKNSTCWKITKPLRGIMHLMKKY